MRVATLFKRLLGLAGVRVVGVELEEPGGEPLVVVHLARPARRVLACSVCGQVGRAIYDHIERRWRHRDVLGARCQLRCRLARLACPTCGVQCEAVPFARPGSRFSRDFEDGCLWLTRHAPKSVVAKLMRIDWATVGRMLGRLRSERLGGDGELAGLGLRLIGVDEVSHRRGHRYLTVVTCHERGQVIWVGHGDRSEALAAFFVALGPERCAAIQAISADMGAHYLRAIKAHAPQAAICADPFHLVSAGQFALDRLRARHWQQLRADDPERARWLKGVRFALHRGPATRRPADLALIDELAKVNQPLYLAHLWVEQLRALLQGRLTDPEQVLAELIATAPALGHLRFSRLGRTLASNADKVLNTIRLGLSNGRIEAMNSTVRLLSHRARGFRKVEHLEALIHLVCGRLRVELPT
jgi:transposase